VARIDASFLQLPAGSFADAALSRAADLGAEKADFRLERIREASFHVRDGQLDSSGDSEDLGLAVRVLHEGTWGFAAGIDRSPEGAARLAEQAVATAKVSRVLRRHHDDPAAGTDPSPVHRGARRPG
jgi:TldD protein